jgi:hypothetical protein
MKSIVQLYRQNPIFALILNAFAFFIWVLTIIFMIVLMTVAFTG